MSNDEMKTNLYETYCRFQANPTFENYEDLQNQVDSYYKENQDKLNHDITLMGINQVYIRTPKGDELEFHSISEDKEFSYANNGVTCIDHWEAIKEVYNLSNKELEIVETLLQIK